MTQVQLPGSMPAVVAAQPGGPDVLRVEQQAVPQPAAGEVLIRVAAAGVNRPDIMQRQGKYPPPPGASQVLGLEVAGTVVALGAGVSEPALGARVCALVAGGGYAGYVAAPAVQCLPIPAGMDDVQAAALPETVFTVWTNLTAGGRLKAGETLLIQGGSSGIGTVAIQMARAMGARVFVTAGSEDKLEACRQLGAELAVNYRDEDWEERFAAAAPDGIDVVLDMVGGDYIARHTRLLAKDGRHVSIAFQRGAKVEVDFALIAKKRLVLTASTLRPRSVAEKGAIAAELRAQVWPWIEAGRLRPVIAATFPLARAAEAHRLMESSNHIGKIVLTVDAEA